MYKGIGFTFLIALLGYALALIPGFKLIGPMACAIILAVAFRQIWGYPEVLRAGIQFASKKLLRFAIILYGLKLNMDVIFHEGLGLLAWDAGTIIFAITVTLLLAKWLKADTSISLLLGVGTGVCGAAAIAAVAPIIKAKDEDTATSVGIIALVGTVFSICYTLLLPILDVTAEKYGIWSGISLHELAHVALAAAPGGQDALAIGLLAKLGRVFLLIPLCFILVYWMKRKNHSESNGKVDIPWFLFGFIAMSFFGSYVLGTYLPVTDSFMSGVATATTFILTTAMVGLGLNISLADVKTKAMRPFVAMLITSVALSLLTFVLL
ncbi:YeiH family protein [Schinkia azotoformans]|uniref:YeiH family protein n=1 Tax=Schinkia azotoformans TaxID=1454 RepID=UPI002DBB3343|nr:putative sulfate exporter family transporter [Schinkia azotoformans]MEC1717427.1 putative sulfate exporter family transporter [Schinkia azotoformans]MEC1740143.1 putative sulfate exporter family transporter [Schinkia azotoformans]MEC1747558.1 putative sulfate exporter family transporter [Schinkia azotoformans]MEC1757305.1 putative sulfate exporter family transporter [Schinkia azotoformans]MEC1765517.1 putative sulfate exporter family transporter [Schinkia azotoformans]